MDDKFSLVDVVRTIWKWRKAIVILCFLALVGSVVISLALPNYYRATTTFYAANPALAEPERLFGGPKVESVYGNENDINRLLTIGNSRELLDHLIDSFDLYVHYEIDTTHNKAEFRVKETLLSLYHIEKTKYDALEIGVEDKERSMAAAISNAARIKIDEIACRLIKTSQLKTIESLWASIEERESNLTELGDSLTRMRDKYNIINIGSQTEFISELVANAEAQLNLERAKLIELEKEPTIDPDTIIYIKARIAGFKKQLSGLTAKKSDNQYNVNKITRGMPVVEVLGAIHGHSKATLSYDKARYGHVVAAYNAEISSIHIVEAATEPIDKHRPKRSIIVIAAFLITLLFSVIAILLIEGTKNIDWKSRLSNAS